MFDSLRLHGLERIVSADGIKADTKKLSAIANWPRPADMKEVRIFLGFVSYYHDLIEGFAHLADLLQWLVHHH